MDDVDLRIAIGNDPNQLDRYFVTLTSDGFDYEVETDGVEPEHLQAAVTDAQAGVGRKVEDSDEGPYESDWRYLTVAHEWLYVRDYDLGPYPAGDECEWHNPLTTEAPHMRVK
jgi:hypothetical protein